MIAANNNMKHKKEAAVRLTRGNLGWMAVENSKMAKNVMRMLLLPDADHEGTVTSFKKFLHLFIF